MALEKTPLCNFGEKAKDFNLKSVDEKKYSLKDAVQAHRDLEARLLTGPAVIIP